MEKDAVQLKQIHIIDPEMNGQTKAYINQAYDGSEEKVNNLTKEELDEKEFYDEDEEFEGNPCSNTVAVVQEAIKNWYKRNSAVIWYTIYILLLCGYFAYFGYAMYCQNKQGTIDEEGSIRLIVLTVVLAIGISLSLFFSLVNPDMSNFERSFDDFMERYGHIIHIIFILLAIAGNIAVIIVEVILKDTQNLISLIGVASFVIFFYITSHNPARVKWRPVFWGLQIQFYFALAILKWDVGNDIFQWCGDRVTEFLAHSDAGAAFLFGDFAGLSGTMEDGTPFSYTIQGAYKMHFFAFAVLPVIVFFSTAISILYYLGVMQFIIRYLGRALAFVLGTSPAESLNAAGNIFIGQSEAPLMIRPFLARLTNSEIHAILTGGFATIAGSVMAAYVFIGVPANHLLSASVMSAPAALAMSKLSYPETKVSKAIGKDVYKMEKGQERNIVEAASNGASQSIKLVANIAVNLIAFISLLAFINATLTWFGDRVGLAEPLTFEFICSYVFWPVSWVMGVHYEDCRVVGQLIGTKTFINEFVAYDSLSKYIKNRENLTWYEALPSGNNTYTGAYDIKGNDIMYRDFNHTLTGGVIEDRSMVIATYALCGFSNIGSIGIMLGALGAMAPTRKRDLTKLVVRAMICGNVACFLTACIAGLMYEQP